MRVALEDLEDAARMLQRRILLGRLAVLEPRAAAAVTGLLALAGRALRGVPA